MDKRSGYSPATILIKGLKRLSALGAGWIGGLKWKSFLCESLVSNAFRLWGRVGWLEEEGEVEEEKERGLKRLSALGAGWIG